MGTSPRLLYILPQVAYVAELLPAKQPSSYAVHSFRQINGHFFTEEEFLPENLEKLLDKLEPGEYQVILPDFLFTDTILNVKATGEEQVKEYIKGQLLPGLDISPATHQIETFVLTEHRGVYKLQLSALEKSLVAPLAQGMADRALLLSSIVSVSWALKSVISLEPSLSIVQLGDELYLAEHYIGIDQPMSAPVSEAENLIDTVKTLKGAEPSIQTIYVCSSELVAERLRQGLQNTVPLQQLATFDSTDSQLPSYLKTTIESAMRTLATPEYQIPRFKPEVMKTPTGAVRIPSVIDLTEAEEAPTSKVEEKASSSQETTSSDDDAVETEKNSNEVLSRSELPAPITIGVASASSVAPAAKPIIDLTSDELAVVPSEIKTSEKVSVVDEPVTPVVRMAPRPVASVVESLDSFQVAAPKNSAKTMNKSGVIKNKTDVTDLMKLIGIGVVSFIVTVGIGVGLGLGLVLFTNKQAKPNALISVLVSPTPIPSVSTVPATSPSPVATSSTKLSDMKVLVVNATSIAGHAGKVAQKLKTAGVTQVKTANAQGKYQPGSYLLTAAADPALLTLMKEKTGLASLSAQTTIKTEDPQGQYSAVVVLAE